MTLTKSHPHLLLTLILIGMLAISIASTSFLTKPATADSGGSWLSGWRYRKSHVITHASGAEENYQVRITTYYSTPTQPFQDTRFGHFTKYIGNPLTSIPKYSANGVVHPDVHYFAGGKDGYEYWMVYTPYPPDSAERPSILRSTDGITWTDSGITNPVVSEGPCNPDPDMIYVSTLNKWFMVWTIYWSGTAQKICLAYSSNGKTWTKYNGNTINGNTNPIILSGDDAGKQPWESSGGNSKTTEPTLLYEDGRFYLYYCDWVNGNNNGRVGLATFQWDNIGNNIENFQRNTSNPLIDIGGCGHADVSKSGSTYYMYVVKGQDLVALTSTNKITWTNRGIVLQSSTGDWDSSFIYRSSPLTDGLDNIIDFSGSIKLYYSAWGSPSIGLATGTDVGAPPPSTDNGENVYLNQHCRTDFSDIRFTRSDGTTLLDYWMESKVDGDHATFWVKIADNLTESDQTVYVYYGKSDATTTSNAKATSLYNQGDDFNDNLQDKARWDWFKLQTANLGTATETNQRLQLYIGQAATTVGFISHNTISTASNFEMSILAHKQYTGHVALYLHTNRVANGSTTGNFDTIDIYDNCYRIMLEAGNWYVQRKLSGVTQTHFGSWASSENTLRIRVEGDTIKFLEGNTQKWSETWALPSRNCYIVIESWGGSGTDWADNFWIRKYVSPEPTHGSWGTEEKTPTTITVGCNPTTVLKTGTQTTTISGQLTSLGSGISGKTIKLYYQGGAGGQNVPPTDGTWTLIKQTLTGSGGSYSDTWDPLDTLPNGWYWIKASFEGDTDYSPSYATTGVNAVSNLFVIPEYAVGTILALAVCFAGFVTYKRSKRGKQKTL